MSNGKASGEGGRVPQVRYFIPCDRVERRHGGDAYSLTRVRHEIPNPVGSPFPRLYAELWFYLQLTDGTGSHALQIQQVCLRDQERIFRWPSFTVDMGTDPTAVHEWPLRLSQVVFWEPGQCEFLLYCGNRQFAVAVVDVR
jgi:hypothetical protein